MSGGRFRGRYNHRRAQGIPVPIPWRLRQRQTIIHNEAYHSNIASPGGQGANVVTLHVTFNTPMLFIPPANNYGHEVGPYIWIANNTHANAFHATYHGIGNGTTCLQFTSNVFNANAGYIGGAGDISISNSTHTVIQTIDLWGNQWLLLPSNQEMPGQLNLESTIEPTANTTIPTPGVGPRPRRRRRSGRGGGGLRGAGWRSRVETPNTDPTTGGWTIYYANTTYDGTGARQGPNVAFTPTGTKTIHEWTEADIELGQMSDMELWFNYPQSAPHGYIWVANGAGAISGNPESLEGYNLDSPANNLIMYAYLCNSSFNPSTNSSKLESCGGTLGGDKEVHREDFTGGGIWGAGKWTSTFTVSGTANGGPAWDHTHLRVRGSGRPMHSVNNTSMNQFWGNTYPYITVRIKANHPMIGTTTHPDTTSFYGRIDWVRQGQPNWNFGQIGETTAYITRNGTIQGEVQGTPGTTRDYTWKPIITGGYVDLTWDMSNIANWGGNTRGALVDTLGSPGGPGLINSISIMTYTQLNLIDYSIDSIRVWGPDADSGGGFAGPNNCSWVGVDPEGLKGKWVQSSRTFISNGEFGAVGASDWIGLTANTQLAGNTYYDVADEPEPVE